MAKSRLIVPTSRVRSAVRRFARGAKLTLVSTPTFKAALLLAYTLGRKDGTRATPLVHGADHLLLIVTKALLQPKPRLKKKP